MSSNNHESERVIVNQAATDELRKYKEGQTMFETMQNINHLSLSFVEWQFLYEEAEHILDKNSFKMFRGIAQDKMLDTATSFAEFKIAKKGGRIADKTIEKMKKMPRSEKEKWEFEHILERHKR